MLPSELMWLYVRIRPLFTWHLASFFCLTAGSVLALVNPLVLMWIIDRVGAMRAAVFDGKTTGTDVFGKLLLEFEPAVVSANCYGLHQKRETSPPPRRSRIYRSIVNRANWAVKRGGDVYTGRVMGYGRPILG